MTIFNPLARPHPAPLDRFWIKTAIPIDHEVIENPSRFRQRTRLPLRKFSPTKTYSKKGEYLSCKLFIEDYWGLVVHIDKRRAQPWMLRKIEANIAMLLHGGNGGILDESELQLGLSHIIELLTPLLNYPKDDIHLVPGLATNPVASWQMVEIPFNIFDPYGRIEHVFMNPRHPNIKKPALRGDGESVKLGHKNALMKINFYRKDLQMKKTLRRYDRSPLARIFRIEVSLKDDKLLKHLGPNGVVQKVQGHSHVTSFTGKGLIAAHLKVVTALTGCYQSRPDKGDLPTDSPMGRFMAHISTRTGLPVEDQISICKERFGISPSTRGRYHKAALNESTYLSPLRVEDIFSPYNYQHQPVIEVPELEQISQVRRDYTDIHPLVAKVYS